MSATKKPKSTVAKAGVNKNKAFRFRWWMALILVVIVAGIGVAVLRFSHAATALTITAENGAGTSGGYVTVANGSFAQTHETFQNIVEGNDPAKVDSADIEVCWQFRRFSSDGNPASYTMEILNWGGGQVAVQPDVLYVAANLNKCVRGTVSSPNASYNFFYKFIGTNANSLSVNGVTRRTLAVHLKNTGGPVATSTGGVAAPPAAPPAQCGQTTTAPCDFGNGNVITSRCGYSAVGPYASLCPGNINEWTYVGLNSSFVGTWDQNRARGVTSEMDVGYWRYKGLCGIKSHVVSDPNLTKVSEANGIVHFYLVGCPTASDIFAFKRANAPKPVEQPAKGTLYITKYTPFGPQYPNIAPDGNKKANGSTVPGNTNVCVKNNHGSTFACATSNPQVLGGLLTSDSPYLTYFTPPSGWKVTRTLINGQVARTSSEVSVELAKDRTTFVDFYFSQ